MQKEYVAVVISSNDGCAVKICRELIIQYSVVFAVAGTSNTVHLQRASLLSLIRILAAVYIRSVVTIGIKNKTKQLLRLQWWKFFNFIFCISTV